MPRPTASERIKENGSSELQLIEMHLKAQLLSTMREHDIEAYKRAFVLDCEIDMEANACDLAFFKVDSSRDFYREFLVAAKDHKFRLWLRYQILDGAETLESHGVSTKKGRLTIQIVVEAYHVFQFVNPFGGKKTS
jgi:hypothetical protein